MHELRRSGLARILLIFCLFVALLIPARFVQGHPLSYVPLDHWSYQAFYRLASLGLIPLHTLTARPIARVEARQLVEQAYSKLSQVDPVIASLAMDDLRNLSKEFSSDSSVRITVGGLTSNRSLGAVMPYRALGASSITVQFPVGSNLLFYGRAVGGGEVGDTLRNEVYASFQLGTVFGRLGRASFSWGPSFRSNLLLSDNAGTLPVLSFSTELPRARLTKVVALLERSVFPGTGPSPSPSDAMPGVLYATRLDWSLAPQLRFGVSEVVVTTWSFPLTLYNLLQPLPGFFSTVAAPFLYDALGLPHHIMATVDFDWLMSPGTRLYGEVMIDDIPPDRARIRMGLLGGLYLSDPFRTGRTGLRLEYSLVTNETYSYAHHDLDYTYQGRSLGHWLGADGDDIYLELSHRVNESATLQISYSYTRHGQGIVGFGSFGSGGFSLSGIVETRQTLGFQLHIIHSPSLESRSTVELSSVANRGNIAGAQALEGLVALEVTYQWPSAEAPFTPQRLSGQAQAPQPIASSPLTAGHIALRSWSSTSTSTGPFSGPPASTFLGVEFQTRVGSLPLSLAYDVSSQGDQMFWSADLSYPVMEFRDGTVWILGGWGGLQFTGSLGGTPQPVVHNAPRLGADFLYRLTLNDTPTPFYFIGQVTSDLGKATSAILARPMPQILFFTYTLGVGWSQNGVAVEAGYRGVGAVWQPEGPNQTSLRWDGLYLSMIFR